MSGAPALDLAAHGASGDHVDWLVQAVAANRFLPEPPERSGGCCRRAGAAS